MHARKIWISSLVSLLLTSAAAAQYQPNWESLSRHEAAPQWFQDAKLGIYFHWGVYSVPAYASEWYPYHMHRPGHDIYRHHLKTYGHPSKFGYHDFIRDFTAEHFDAEQWAEVFADAGARFAGPVAEHHDGFAMWDSEVTPWNAADMGPKRDITGELFTALRKRGLKTIATFHHARNLQRYPRVPEPSGTNKEAPLGDSHYPNYEGMPTASNDPELQLLYGNMPEEQWLDQVWLGKLKEVIDKYQPDIVWFDSWLDKIPEAKRQEFAAYYLNQARRWNKEVVVVRKQDDLPLSFSVNDHEKSREPKALKEVWMTDDTISTGSWCYTSNLRIKPLDMVVHALVDTVSKNGVVLLNLSPKADGVIPDDQLQVLRSLGDWMRSNGEAIYATRPWVTFGEGPTSEPAGGFSDREKFLELKYSAKDIRFTQSKDGLTVYAIVLGTPEPDKEFLLKSFAKSQRKSIPKINAIQRVSDNEPVGYELREDGLAIVAPPADVESCAVAFRIKLASPVE